MTSRICTYCTTTIGSGDHISGTHHSSITDLKSSATEEHCVFCSTLQRDVEKHVSNPEGGKWPLYRWSLRRAASIRESPSMVVVVFRSLAPSSESGENGGDKDVNGLKKDARSVDLLRLPERTFHFYREKDLGHVPKSANLGMRTDSEESWNCIAAWMADCTGPKHPRCRRRTVQRFVPTRLLDIGAVKPQQNIYGNILVVETRPSDVNKRYATLSHTWGPDPHFITLTVKNRKELMTRGVPWANLTNNFRETIITARRLRIRHIWIDSLCIIQGQGGDFLTEKDKMHQVYRQSFCNIAAADAFDDASGLFRSRQLEGGGERSSIVPASFQSTADNLMFGDDVWRIIPNDIWDSELLNGSLYKRAWVFQERMLAPRIVHFSSEQIFWDCSTVSACEVLPSGLPRPLDTLAASDRHWRERLQDGLALKHRPLGGTADLSVEEFWKVAVRNYTSCALTNYTDKLSAIWGVVKLLRDVLEEEYAAGLWIQRLEEQLAWRVVDCRQEDGNPSVRPINPDVPSWSWASMKGIVELQDRLTDRDYIVSNHLGGDIEFRVKQDAEGKKSPRLNSPEQELTLDEGMRLWERKSPQPTPNISRVNSGLSQNSEIESYQSPQDGINSPKTQQQSNDEHPELETPVIEIRGCVRHGSLQLSNEVGKWTLSVEHDEEGLPPPDVFDVGTLEVFPDEEPNRADLSCSFMVLAFSEHKKVSMQTGFSEDGLIRQSRRVTVSNYSGIGLLLRDEGNRYYSRIGSFRFHDFPAARTDILTLVNGVDDISEDSKDRCRLQNIALI